MPQSNWAHAPQLLSLHSGDCEPQLLSPHATTTEAHTPGARALQREATARRGPCTSLRSGPHSPQVGRARAQQQRPNAAKETQKPK